MSTDYSTILSTEQSFRDFKWYNSYSLPQEIHCNLKRLELPYNVELDTPSEIFVVANIICNQILQHEIPISTNFSHIDKYRNCLVFDYNIGFPVKIKDLTIDAIIAFTAYTADNKIYGGTTIRLFDDKYCLKFGKQKLLFYFGRRGDTNVIMSNNTTQGDIFEDFKQWDPHFKIEKAIEQYQMQLNDNSNSDKRDDWLDKLTLNRLQYYYEYCYNRSENSMGCTMEELELKSFAFLIIELPNIQYKIIHEEKQYPTVNPHNPPMSQLIELSPYIVDPDSDALEFNLSNRPFNASSITVIADWDMGQENLSEELNRRLNHNARRGIADSNVKPNLAEREIIERLIQTVSNHFSNEDIDLLYRFRYSLTDNKKALTKFLLTVNWDEESEVAELPILLALWKKNAPIDVVDALKLLGREKAFEHPLVREYAVEVLRSASDDELLTFLLQLVQALRYESNNNNGIVDFTLEKSIIGVNISNSPSDNAQKNSWRSNKSKSSPVKMMRKLSASSVSVDSNPTGNYENNSMGLSPLANFLIERGVRSPVVANYLYWYLKVETEDEQAGYLFESVFDAFIVQLSTSGGDGNILFKRMTALNEYVEKISSCQRDAREQGKRKEGKEECLRKLLEQRNLQSVQDCIGIDWVPMPLDPHIKLSGLIPSTAMMFASAIYPCVIEFNELCVEETTTRESFVDSTDRKMPTKTHKIMFKSGDDLRQDQLIVQMIELMDSLLKKVNLDMKLLTYKILAVGQKDGIMEFIVNSNTISGVLKQFGSITEFLRHHSPDKNGPFQISPKTLDTFIRSCAGTCVVTYILGVGDRHLDNIMINKSGQMFHIDFGFIFGQDPKPFPPPFRFTRAMADAMGGEESEHYARFKSFCCQAYNWLRKSASLILNLLNLMGDAGIQDISKRSDISKVLIKVEEKFRLDLNDEQAEKFFLGLINESLHALAPKLMEGLHKIAVSMR